MKKTIVLSFVMVFFVFNEIGWASSNFLARGAMSGASSQTIIIATSEVELQSIRSLFLPGLREELKVDFDHDVAIFAFGGRCPSAGYHVEIDELSYCGKDFEISLRTVKPEGGFFAQIITSPWVVVTVAKE